MERVDVDDEGEDERLNKAKEEVKKANISVDMRYLYERLKKSVNLNSTASEIEFPNCNLQLYHLSSFTKNCLKNDN